MNILTQNRKSLTLCQELESFAKPTLEKLNLNYFQYLKVFKDGSFSFHGNRADWKEFVIDFFSRTKERMVYSHPPEKEYLDKNNYYFTWEHNLPKEPQLLAKEFNINQGITFVERTEDYYTMMAYAAPEKNSRPLNIYLNNLTYLKQTLDEFKHEKKDLIKLLDANRIFPSYDQQDENLDKMFSDIGKKILLKDSYVTAREFECLKLLSKGASCKDIANTLKISPRTVETYFNRVKLRLNINSKKELIKLIYL